MQELYKFKDKEIPEFDPRTGDHYWHIIANWKVDPLVWLKGDSHLDSENLLTITAPCCYYCERFYTPLLAKRRCKGGATSE